MGCPNLTEGMSGYPNGLCAKIISTPVLISSLAQQPLVDPGLLKKLCPFVSVEGDFLPILDP
jgi:hypothetical protein